MQIQLLSDLHLEVHPHFKPEPAHGADVLVLAGDIGSYQPGSLLQDTDFGLARFSPLPQFAGWPTPVLFVPGNHEYDMQDFDVAHARLRAICERLGMVWLEREVAHMRFGTQAVRFVGTTLWTDFDALGPAAEDPQATLADALKARDKAFRAANFYLKKTGSTRSGEAMLAPAIREQGLACQAWLREALARPFDGDTVVVTHFAPSLASADPRYGLTPGTAGFCNALDDLLPQARLWLHGHLHAPSDYLRNGCRVVANPLGYARKNEQQGFDPRRLIQLAAR
ncbi:metallophosphoesterase [Rhodoferax koreense]|uniref:Metallophosphoesterase n=1 Tax=Rhodoferax koreensis TaxID=1842727 RepID=A0A1P8JQC2_9BURK|nr:metallophosphoesterase [Rhodoferax koreense]APW35915.1 metallophosphoesterase [Rhodoferax koreense]